MILIADGGSTKIEWALLDEDRTLRLRKNTPGYNAAMASPGDLNNILALHFPELATMGRNVREVHFYGAGCGSEACCTRVEKELADTFPAAEISAKSDMLAAARALCGDKPGIACILGTGSNSCLYDGKEITANVSPLGFILGDEGSGAVMGRGLIGGMLKHQFSEDITRIFHEKYPVDTAEIIENVYRRPRPNAYLASFAPFLSENISHPEIEEFVCAEFERFFTRNIAASGRDDLQGHFVGAIAVHFSDQLKKTAARLGLRPGNIIQAPMGALISYHSGK